MKNKKNCNTHGLYKHKIASIPVIQSRDPMPLNLVLHTAQTPQYRTQPSRPASSDVPTRPLTRPHPEHTANVGVEGGGGLDGESQCRMSLFKSAMSPVSLTYFPRCHMSKLRNSHVSCHYLFLTTISHVT